MKSEVIYGEDQRSKPSNMMSENKEELTKEVGKKGWKRDEKNQVNSSSGSQAKIKSIKERVGPRYSIIQISQSFGFNLQSGNIQEATKECVNIDVSLSLSLPLSLFLSLSLSFTFLSSLKPINKTLKKEEESHQLSQILLMGHLRLG